MNKIKLHNVTGIYASSHGVEVNHGKQYLAQHDKMAMIVILNEEEINNRDTTIKLKSTQIDVLLIPNKFKYIFFDTELGKYIDAHLTKNHHISYF